MHRSRRAFPHNFRRIFPSRPAASPTALLRAIEDSGATGLMNDIAVLEKRLGLS